MGGASHRWRGALCSLSKKSNVIINKNYMETKNDTKKCPHCQTDISAKAKKCPNCQSDLRNWPTRHPILTLLGLLIIVPIIVSWIIPNESSSPKTSNTNQNQNSEQTEQKEQQPLLELQSLHCYSEYGYFIIEGMVKNISGESLESVLAVGNTYTADGEFVKSSDALIEYNPILSGQTSPFKTMATDNPAIKKCDVNFKEFWGGTILTKDGRAK